MACFSIYFKFACKFIHLIFEFRATGQCGVGDTGCSESVQGWSLEGLPNLFFRVAQTDSTAPPDPIAPKIIGARTAEFPSKNRIERPPPRLRRLANRGVRQAGVAQSMRLGHGDGCPHCPRSDWSESARVRVRAFLERAGMCIVAFLLSRISRIAVAANMLSYAEGKGNIGPGSNTVQLIGPTSGNTGNGAPTQIAPPRVSIGSCVGGSDRFGRWPVRGSHHLRHPGRSSHS